MKNYQVRTGCEIAGHWRDAGEIISLSGDQARELAPPFGDVVAPISQDEASTDGKFGRRKRGNRKAAD